MIDRIGRNGALAREALQAAIKQASERVAARAPEVSADAPEAPEAPAASAASGADGARDAQGPDFGRALADGLSRVDGEVRSAESLPIDLLTGKVDDFHQIAVQLKSAELSFKFAMEIRNKLVDAYREVMRMNV